MTISMVWMICHESAAQSQPSSTEPASAVVASFPTVVILESTPKPTPPDTPARGLSPTSETPRSSFHHQQSLSPLHALAISTTPLSSEQSETLSLKPQQAFSIRPSPENNAPTSESSSLTSSHSPPITGHPGPTAAIENSPSLMMALAPIPAVPAFGRGDKEAPPPPKTAPPHSADSREGGALTSFGPLSLLHPTSATISQESPNSTGMGAMAPLQHQQQSHQAPRMFFLQRDSSSLSPDSNSRSGSHSRSPGGSRSPDGRIAHEAHAHGSSNSPGPRNGESSAGAGLMREASTHRERERSSSIDGEKHHSRVFMSGTGAEKEAMPRYGSLVAASEEPKPKQQVVAVTAAGARESPEHLHQHQQMQQQVDVVNQRPSPPPSEQTNMSVPAASSSSSSHTHPSRPHRLVMRSKKGGYRPHLGRGVERPSSRASTRGSASSNASHHQRGTTGVGSMEANNSGGSMSTSAGSNIVMRRHVRVHSPLRNAPVSENAGDQQLKLQQQLRELSHEKPASATGQLPPALAPASASASGQLQQQQKQEPHVSPLAVLPEPLRMEVLERQVVQSAMKGQGDGRKISLESDSEDDYTDDDDDDDDVDDSEDEIVVQKGKGKVGNTVEAEEDGSSWSDEDDGEEVMIAKKRPQAQCLHHSLENDTLRQTWFARRALPACRVVDDHLI
ncbi:hypothetical protein M408DRAFT_152411 [Serendipita vermifera MAFF 305830]|uniref:Uncharacterized protein n=1 Tax=Serendipita vermifera MAFF 305830 TaxID=933852 RepID=A0A0C2X598_SERVB|nr:hypothetical protein M408DRAFT_152411 [Serendipita vermifera MAFF 305830]